MFLVWCVRFFRNLKGNKGYINDKNFFNIDFPKFEAIHVLYNSKCRCISWPLVLFENQTVKVALFWKVKQLIEKTATWEGQCLNTSSVTRRFFPQEKPYHRLVFYFFTYPVYGHFKQSSQDWNKQQTRNTMQSLKVERNWSLEVK